MTTLTSTAFTLKGSMMTLTVLHLRDPHPSAVDKQLSKTITETPELFRNMPVVIDLQHLLDYNQSIDFVELSALMREYGLIPVGTCNGNQQLEQAAKMAGLGTLAGVKNQASKSSAASRSKTNKAPVITHAKIITQPVRSGQRIYAQNTDLIIQSSVSNGAEIIADGNIHVYGSLRGRAIAGAQGYENARIFCSSLQAELISIAGNFKLQDKIEPTTGPVVVHLADGALTIDPM